MFAATKVAPYYDDSDAVTPKSLRASLYAFWLEELQVVEEVILLADERLYILYRHKSFKVSIVD